MFEFDWDEANSSHIAEHSVSCDEAEQVIQNAPFDLDYQIREDEERLLQIGETNAGRILIVASTVRGSKIRVVTAFDARKTLRKKYIVERGLRDGSGT